MIRQVFFSLASLGSLFSSSMALSAGGYSQTVIAHNLTGAKLQLNCKGGDTRRNKQTTLESDKAKIIMSASLESSTRTLLGGSYTCSYNYASNSGRVTFKLKSAQAINVLKVTEESLLDGKLQCTSERFSNFSQPSSIMKTLNNGGSHRGRKCN